MQKFVYLVGLYLKIILLRAKPQDVPANSGVLVGTVAAAVITYAAAITSQFGVTEAVLRALLDLTVLVAVLHGGLKMVGHPQRFSQGYSALCGTAAVLNLLFWPVLSAIGGTGGLEQSGPLVMLVLLLLYVWSVMVIAHIFRHCFDTSTMVGVMVSIAYLIVVVAISGTVFPPVEGAASTNLVN